MRVPKTVSFGSVNLLEGSGRNVYLYLLVYHKKKIYCNLDEEVHRARPRKVQSAGTSVAMALGCTTLLAPARKLISSYCSRVFTVLNLLQHPPSSSPRSQVGRKFQPLPIQIVITRAVHFVFFQINELSHVQIPVMLMPDDFKAYSKIKVDNHLFNK